MSSAYSIKNIDMQIQIERLNNLLYTNRVFKESDRYRDCNGLV